MNEIQVQTLSGQTLYAVIRDQSDNVWQTTTTTFVAYVSANVANYAVAMSEVGVGSGLYAANFPIGITTPGTYSVTAFQRIGGSPSAPTDTAVAAGDIVWNGSGAVIIPTGGNLITLDYFKPFVGVSLSDHSKDTILTALILGASDAINRFLNRNLLIQTYSEYYDFSQPERTLVLRQFPVTALSQITIYTQGVPTVIEGSNFIWTESGLVQFSPTSINGWYFPPGFQSVNAQYTAGFDSIPNDIQLACATVVQRVYLNLARNPLITSQKIGDYAVTYKSAIDLELMTPDVRSILTKHRSPA